MHSFLSRIFLRSHTFQIQSIRKSISQRPHTTTNQSIFTFQNFSFHRATNQSDTLLQISQSRYVSISAVSFALTYVLASDNALVYAPRNASVYLSVYAFDNAFVYAPIYASVYAFTTGYEPATNYALELASALTPALTRAPRFEMTVLD